MTVDALGGPRQLHGDVFDVVGRQFVSDEPLQRQHGRFEECLLVRFARVCQQTEV